MPPEINLRKESSDPQRIHVWVQDPWTRMALSGDIAATCGVGLLVPLQVKGLWQCVSLEWERYSVTNR